MNPEKTIEYSKNGDNIDLVMTGYSVEEANSILRTIQGGVEGVGSDENVPEFRDIRAGERLEMGSILRVKKDEAGGFPNWKVGQLAQLDSKDADGDLYVINKDLGRQTGSLFFPDEMQECFQIQNKTR